MTRSHEHPSTPGDYDANSERLSTPSPRIYVASLADYNAGRLHGVWLEADREPAEVHADIQALLAASSEPGAEEYAIHDYDGFGDARLDEYDSLELVCRIARGITAHGLAFAAWAEIFKPATRRPWSASRRLTWATTTPNGPTPSSSSTTSATSNSSTTPSLPRCVPTRGLMPRHWPGTCSSTATCTSILPTTAGSGYLMGGCSSFLGEIGSSPHNQE